MEKSFNVKAGLRILFPTLLLIAGLEFLIWAHWSSLAEVASEWRNPKYSHGYLVPIFAAVLLWLRRDEKTVVDSRIANIGVGLAGVGLGLCVLQFLLPDLVMTIGNAIGRTTIEAIGLCLCVAGSLLYIQQRIQFESVPVKDRWIGLAILIFGEAVWMVGTYRSSNVVEYYGFLPAVLGLFVMVGGLSIVRWAGWSIFFLAFMLPLPGFLDKHLSGGLQNYATRGSTFLLQTLGIAATRDGTHILVGERGSDLFVAEACSGLRMLTIFGAMSVAVALLIQRPMWQRITIVLSAIPIALIVNVVRIVLTGVLFTMLPENDKQIHEFVHGMWGFVMMPMALGLMFLEFQILNNLVIEDDDDMPVPLSLGMPAKAKSPAMSIGAFTPGKPTGSSNTSAIKSVSPTAGPVSDQEASGTSRQPASKP